MYVFDYLGNNLNGFPAFFPNLTTNLGDRMAIYDLDNTGKLDIIVARGNIMSIYNYNGQIRNGWPKFLGLGNNISISFPSIGDLNHDNIPEIIFPASNYNSSIQQYDSNKIYIFEPNGQLYLNQTINSNSNYFFWFNPAVIFKNKNKDSTFFVINSNNSPSVMSIYNCRI